MDGIHAQRVQLGRVSLPASNARWITQLSEARLQVAQIALRQLSKIFDVVPKAFAP